MSTQQLRIEESAGQVSLWMPRFDVVVSDGIAQRIGVESVYSIIDAGPGSAQDHFDVIERLWQRLSLVSKMSAADFVKEYVARDLLNLAFGNSDNHGRNTAFLKLADDVRFAPIYDFAPMKADPEVVTRLFRWGDNCERGGDVDFVRVAERLSHLCPMPAMLAFLQLLAGRLIAAPQLLQRYGCPQEILQFPTIGFDRLEQKLRTMGIYHA